MKANLFYNLFIAQMKFVVKTISNSPRHPAGATPIFAKRGVGGEFIFRLIHVILHGTEFQNIGRLIHWNILLILLFLGLTACSQEKKSPVNTLSKKEVKEGWQLLFDGKTTDGWRGYNKSSFPEIGWTIENGCLKCLHSDKGEAGNGGDIVTKKKYSNFELKLEWKIAKSGNSGIMYLVTEIPGKHTFYAAPEMQIIDSVVYPRKLKPEQLAGSAYGLIAASPQNVKPHGEWNQIRILVNKGHVEHWQNGEKVVEFNLWTPEWNELVSNSKFMTNPDFKNVPKEGNIALQDHGGGVWFRDIKIRELQRFGKSYKYFN